MKATEDLGDTWGGGVSFQSQKECITRDRRVFFHCIKQFSMAKNTHTQNKRINHKNK